MFLFKAEASLHFFDGVHCGWGGEWSGGGVARQMVKMWPPERLSVRIGVCNRAA